MPTQAPQDIRDILLLESLGLKEPPKKTHSWNALVIASRTAFDLKESGKFLDADQRDLAKAFADYFASIGTGVVHAIAIEQDAAGSLSANSRNFNPLAKLCSGRFLESAEDTLSVAGGRSPRSR